MKSEILWLLAGLLMHGNSQTSDYGEEKKGKDGYCVASPNGLYEPPCNVACEADSECAGDEKCCEFACSYICKHPSREKPGMCPYPPMKKLHAPLMLQTSCTEDSQCAGAEKCCETGCGQMCRMPLGEKPGKCPRKQRQTKAEACQDTCSHDAECQGPEKCCFTGCSMNCFNVQ